MYVVLVLVQGDRTCACMSSAPGTIDRTGLSLSAPHLTPRSAAVNESGLIFLYLVHKAYNLADEIDQENKAPSAFCYILFSL